MLGDLSEKALAQDVAVFAVGICIQCADLKPRCACLGREWSTLLQSDHAATAATHCAAVSRTVK